MVEQSIPKSKNVSLNPATGTEREETVGNKVAWIKDQHFNPFVGSKHFLILKVAANEIINSFCHLFLPSHRLSNLILSCRFFFEM
jgi:hypothetical protein